MPHELTSTGGLRRPRAVAELVVTVRRDRSRVAGPPPQELERASLLIQHTPGRYRMHDLIRACARDHANCDLTSVDRHTALSRVIDFYVHTAHRAHLLLEPHDHYIALRPPVPGCRPQQLTNRTEALEWFTAEHYLRCGS
jgi:hypothetical protein